MSNGKATCVMYIGHGLSLEEWPGVTWEDHMEKEALRLGLEEEAARVSQAKSLDFPGGQ